MITDKSVYMGGSAYSGVISVHGLSISCQCSWSFCLAIRSQVTPTPGLRPEIWSNSGVVRSMGRCQCSWTNRFWGGGGGGHELSQFMGFILELHTPAAHATHGALDGSPDVAC